MTEKLILSSAVNLIEKLVDARYEYVDIPDAMKVTIGEISGIIEMTNALLEALNNDTRTGNQRD